MNTADPRAQSLSREDTPSFIKKLDSSEIKYQNKSDKPKVLRQYILGRSLGSGSYGKVREGIDPQSMQRIAVKIIDRKKILKMTGGDYVIQREIRIHRKLKHKNVVQLLNSFKNERKGKLYIVVEYCNGGSLQSLLDRAPNKRLPLKQARELFSCLLDGLEYIHSQKIVHKDIKPDNLLLTTDGVLKISDFGVAENIDKNDDDDNFMKSYLPVVGSPAFQPPECIGGCPPDTSAPDHSSTIDTTETGEEDSSLVTAEESASGAWSLPSGSTSQRSSLRLAPTSSSTLQTMITAATNATAATTNTISNTSSPSVATSATVDKDSSQTPLVSSGRHDLRHPSSLSPQSNVDSSLATVKRKGSHSKLASSKNNNYTKSPDYAVKMSSKGKDTAPNIMSTVLRTHSDFNPNSNSNSGTHDHHLKPALTSQKKIISSATPIAQNEELNSSATECADNITHQPSASAIETTTIQNNDSNNDKQKSVALTNEKPSDTIPKGDRNDRRSYSMEKFSTTATTTTTTIITTGNSTTTSLTSATDSNRNASSTTEPTSEENVVQPSNLTGNNGRSIAKGLVCDATPIEGTQNQTQQKTRFIHISPSHSTKRMKKISGSSTTTTTGTEPTDRQRDAEVEQKRLMKVDVWSAGVVLYMMVIGKYPFGEQKNWLTLLDNISKANFTLPNNVDPLLAELLRSMMNPDPERRFTVQQCKQHRWMEVELPNQPYIPIVHIDSLFGTDQNSVKLFVNKVLHKESNDANTRDGGGDNASSKHSMESDELHSKSSTASLGNITSGNTQKPSATKRRKSTPTKLKEGKEKKRSRCTLM
jgi:serine/threonine protein kinase